MAANLHCLDFLEQTANFRFSPQWEITRHLIAMRGISAEQVLLFSCDHAGGPNMSIWLALQDGSIIDAVIKEDSISRLYTSIAEWRIVEPADDEMLLASRIMTSSDLADAFSKTVLSYYDFLSRCG